MGLFGVLRPDSVANMTKLFSILPPCVHQHFIPRHILKPMHSKLACTALLALLAVPTGAWGVRGHETANRAAVQSIPDDGPVFLRNYVDWIAQTGPLPDSWRGNSEPYSKLF